MPTAPAAFAVFGPGSGAAVGTRAAPAGLIATDLVEVSHDLSVLDSAGRWAVVLPYAGPPTCARFDTWRPVADARWREVAPAPWPGVPMDRWRSSLDRRAFGAGVEAIREAIAAGDVYQVNLTRRLSAPLPGPVDASLGDRRAAALAGALGRRLHRDHPSDFGATVVLPEHGVAVASASPERFLSRAGDAIWSSPIKGTAPIGEAFSAKDLAENVMIVDLVRNDLGRVCEYGSVRVPALFAREAHPGLVHLVSTVEGRLRRGVPWTDLLSATFPPGSITGAPKLAAMQQISLHEPAPRGLYCGAIGWVDADHRTADLNVAIRTFWAEGDGLHFGTGGAITYDSTAEGEWNETELKAAKLLALAARSAAEPKARSAASPQVRPPEASGSTVRSSTSPMHASASSTTG